MENPIGIIGAMDVEVELLKESMAAEGAVETSHTGQLSFFTGTLSGVPVVVAQCDVGMVNAAAHTQLLIDRFAVRGVVKSVDVQAKKIVLDGEILKQICV